MSRPRQQFIVSYRVLDPKGKTLEVIRETGPNKRVLQRKVERHVLKKYGEGHKVHAYKVQKEG